jgi:nucleoid DNA-binding protein
MTTQDLAKELSKETGISIRQCFYIISKLIHITSKAIVRGHMVKLSSLATFYADVSDQKNYFNTHKKSYETLPKRFVLKIKPSPTLKKKVNAKKIS